MIKIAVIDDGVIKSKFQTLDFDVEIDHNNTVIQHEDNFLKDCSHGTTCAMIIKKYVPDATIGSIKILHSETWRGYVDQLRSAFDWCVKNCVSLINLSLGSVQSSDFTSIYECVENAYHNQIVIVAALCNQFVVTYPASFPNVIGVKTDPLLSGDMYYMQSPCIEGVDVIASSVHSIEDMYTPICNSFAAPLITAKVYSLMLKYGYREVEQIKACLNELSYKKIVDYCIFHKPHIFAENIDDISVKPVNIPCIILKAQNGNMVYILNELFNKNGYNTVFISTYLFDKRSNVWIVAPEQLYDKTISYLAYKHNADIIIIGICHDDIKRIANITCDILFDGETSDTSDINGCVKSKILYERRIRFKHGKTANFLYNEAIKCLS